ncbi:MAG: MDR family MFS transporter [Myxococcaceae bacterium]
MIGRVLPVLKASLGGLSPIYWVLWSGTLINRLGAFVLPFLQIFLTSERGLSVADAGGLISLYGLGALLSNPIGGALADKLGRKPTMLIGFCLTAGAMMFLAFAESVERIGLALLILGLVNDLYRPAQMALIADVIPPKDRMRAFSHLYWAINLGAGVGPLIAGVLAKRHFFALFVVDALTTLLCAALIWWKVPDSPPPLPKEGEKRRSQLAELALPFLDRAFGPYVLVTFFFTLIFFQFLAALPADMKAHGFAEDSYGLTIAVNGFMIVLLQPFVTGSVAKGNRANLLALAALLTGVGYGLNGFADHLLGFWMLSVVVWTAAEIMMAPVNSSVVADLSPDHMRGRYQAAYNMAWSLALIAAPLLGTQVLEHFGSRALWFGCAGLGVFTAGLQLLIGPLRRRRMMELHGAAKID